MTRTSLTTKSSCDATIAEHADIIILGSGQLGFGFRCEDAYKALIELAEVLRSVYGWERYTAHGLLRQLEEDTNEAIINRSIQEHGTHGTN